MKTEHIILGIIAIGIFTGYISIQGFNQPATTYIPPTTPTTPGISCESTVTPDITISAVDVDNPTTAITDSSNLYMKEPDGSLTTFTLGTEITDLQFGKTYEFFMPASTTTATAAAGKGFCKYMSWTATCDENTALKIYCANDETYDGLTNQSFNNNGDAATATSFEAGNVKTIRLQWTAGKDEYYGHPYLDTYSMLQDHGTWRRKYPNALCLKLNSTAWEEPQEVYLADGTNMNRISAPTITATLGATTHIMYCYEAPVITDRDTDIYVRLEADGTYEPELTDTAYLFAGSLFINSETGKLDWGVEDNKATYTAGNSAADQNAIIVS